MAADRELGLIGLGTMGRNLLLNLADHEVPVAGWDRDGEKVASLEDEAAGGLVRGCATAGELVDTLRRPRAVLLLVPAGGPVDAVLDDLVPRLDAGDVVIDGGNSHFRDTARRQRALADADLHMLGMGISGGADGARHGPSLMPGGASGAWERVRPLFEKAAAHAAGEPCAALLGTGAVGHHVKMVHNGIEYGLMQLLAESYDLLRRGAGLAPEALADVFARWSDGPAGGFLVEITARILRTPDDRGDGLLLDAILDEAGQKGTGKWTSQDAMDLAVPTPVIDAAVSARHLSARRDLRLQASGALPGPPAAMDRDRDAQAALVRNLGEAWHAAALMAYAEGLALLDAADREHGYGLNPATAARVWRAGCIIRSNLLQPVTDALARREDLPHLLLDPELGAAAADRQDALRAVVRACAAAGIPAPAYGAALAHFDGLRTRRLPANLVQAQRDVFGSHGFRRTDREGDFHGDWEEA